MEDKGRKSGSVPRISCNPNLRSADCRAQSAEDCDDDDDGYRMGCHDIHSKVVLEWVNTKTNRDEMNNGRRGGGALAISIVVIW